MRPEVAGSLWSVPADRQLTEARRLADHGLSTLHWDMSDGRFATAGGFAPSRAAEIGALTGMRGEAHLMTAAPEHEVDAWTECCELVIVHVEAPGWRRAVERIRRRGARAGVALSPRTSPSEVPDDIDVLCMSVPPGAAGSTFDRDALKRIAALRARSDQRRVGVDGGVTRAVAEAAADAGADWLVVGTDLLSRDGTARWHDLLAGA
ncbi:MAG: hypothetical protein QM677_00345 [Microbacterium sp.]